MFIEMASTILNNLSKDSMLYEKIAVNPDSDFFKRVESIRSKHQSLFGNADNLRYFSSPGRIEICGNHTDHQNGEVLCASVNLDTLAVVSPTQASEIVICSMGYPLIKVDLNDLSLVDSEIGSSTAIVKGVCKYYIDHGYNVKGFNACATSNVFKGAGISSSASFELLICTILNELFNDGKIDPIEMSVASHYAESVYFGKPCGLLDQCAIAFGGICYIDFKSGMPEATSIPVSLPLNVILVNTEGDHSNLTDQYAQIRIDMNDVAKQFGKKVLREVDEKDFYENMPALRSKVSGRAILRAIHFYNENRRVENARDAVINGDMDAFCEAINASGASSLAYLQNCYPSGDSAQVIPSAVEVLKSLDGIKAGRVHGGGFAGTVLALGEKNEEFTGGEVLDSVFGHDNYYIVNIRPTGATEITKELLHDEQLIIG